MEFVDEIGCAVSVDVGMKASDIGLSSGS